MVGHHLEQGGETSRQAVALGLAGLGFAGEDFGAGAGSRRKLDGLIALGGEPLTQSVGLGLLLFGSFACRLHPGAFARELIALCREFQQVRRRAFGAARGRGPGVLQSGSATEHGHLRLAGLLLLPLGVALTASGLGHETLGRSGLGLHRPLLLGQLHGLCAPLGQALGQGADA